ncbi:hypothetical protein BDW71DRAFT_215689 [Aspergillus fruticulosus]
MLHRITDASDFSAGSMDDRGDDHPRSKKEGATSAAGRLACEFAENVRCDRAVPKYGRCARLGYDCSYRGRKQYSAAQADMPRQLSELQTRLASTTTTPTACPLPPHVDLSWPVLAPPERLGDHERLLQRLQSQVAPPMDRAFEGLDMLADLTEDIPGFWGVMDSVLAPDAFPSVLAGDSTQLPTPFYSVLPILNPSQFRREWAHDPVFPQVRALSYAVALVGSTVAPEYSHLQLPYYSNVCKYIELYERDDNKAHITSLNGFQALLFILRYELTRKHFVRAWMTFSWAVTLAQILNLRHIDHSEVVRQCTRPPQDAPEMGFVWDSLYIFESYGCVRISRPCSLEDDNLYIFLPSPSELSKTFHPSPIPFISDPAKLAGVSYLTSYAAVTIMVKLTCLCFEHISILSCSVTNSSFWDCHYRLVKTINNYTAIFQHYLSIKAIWEDALVFSLHLNLCATYINLHEAAICKVEESRKCSTTVVFKILGAIQMNWPVQQLEVILPASSYYYFTLQATFIGWPFSISLIALSCSLSHGDTTLIGIVDSLRLLQAALDQVEEADGY